MKIVIIGGVAGGASAAARARRLSESAQIIVLERGEHPSFANCGLPYYVGGVIEQRGKLLVAPVQMLRDRHRLDVRVRSEVVQIDRDARCVTIDDLQSGRRYSESYDKLIIATGATPIRPEIPGIDSDNVLELRDLSDADRMHAAATGSRNRRAVIVGAGFIGIEIAENLIHRGIDVTVVQLSDQVLMPWDAEMIRPFQENLVRHGVKLRLGESVTAFHPGATDPAGGGDAALSVELTSQDRLPADFAVVSIGVRPESGLAKAAGLELSSRGGIIVDEHMRTSDPDIYAVGDVCEVTDFVTRRNVQIPLAGPANRQGRIAADHIFGKSSMYRGTQGTAIIGAFGMTAALTGQNERQLIRSQTHYEKIYVHPVDHASYYPGAQAMTLKLLFDPADGRIWGAQCVGGDGVDKRIDVISVAIQSGMTVFDLEEVELCYAPQYGHAKDPINMAGFVAAGVCRGEHPLIHDDDDRYVLDVRSPDEFAGGHVPGATNIPIEQLRDRLDELPKDRPIAAYCKVGQRGYLATRVLRHHGYNAANLSGGYTTWTRRADRSTTHG